MGASSWWYVTPFHPDLNVVLRDLHERVLADHRYCLGRYSSGPACAPS